MSLDIVTLKCYCIGSEAEEMTGRTTYFIIATSRRSHCHCLANSSPEIVGFAHIGAI
jgi:hypothetical protein